jgi:hypothetical protein
MADAITTNVLRADGPLYAFSRLCLSDGTGESAAIVIDKSAMAIGGQSPAVAVGHMSIQRIQGFISGFTSVRFLWDHTTDDTALILPVGAVDMDFSSLGDLHDPQSTGGTGDLLVTTAGASAGDIYHLIIELQFHK